MKPETYQKIRQASMRMALASTEAQYEAARRDFNAAFEEHRKDTFPAPPAHNVRPPCGGSGF